MSGDMPESNTNLANGDDIKEKFLFTSESVGEGHPGKCGSSIFTIDR